MEEPGKKNSVVPLKKKELRNWLKLNAEYTSELKRLESRASCNTTVLEFICYAKLNTNKTSEFKKMIEKEFPEMAYDSGTGVFDGSYKGESITLIIDDVFWRMAKSFIKVLDKNPTLFLFVKNKNNDNDRYDKYTIGEYLIAMDNTYQVRINQRFKGLGESDPEILFATTLNPKLRKLIRFNIDDMKRTLEVFNLLHSKKLAQQRREMLDASEISYMDLDN